MRRNQIIFGSILVLVLASFGAVYQFYFKEKLAQYNKDAQFRKDLQAAAEDLSTFFSGTSPETVITLWSNEVQPWAESLQQRAGYFNTGDWFKHETPPESGRILRVWYGEQLEKQLNQLYQDIAEKAPNLDAFPEDILKALELKTENDMAQEKEVTVQLVNQQLGKLAFATRLLNLLFDEKVMGINDINMWPSRKDKNHRDQLVLQTVGLDINIYMRHLVHLLEVLRRQNRFFQVDAIHVMNPYIANPVDPELRVKLLLTQGDFSGNLDNAAAAGGAGTAKNLFGMTTPKSSNRPPVPPKEEPGFFGTLWKYFKRYVLYQNA